MAGTANSRHRSSGTETGNAFSERSPPRSRHWQQPSNHLFTIDEATPAGLFYTGHMVLGPHLIVEYEETRKMAR
jgi:hypothetical protein